MRKRRRLEDGHRFLGCSRYPQCNGTRQRRKRTRRRAAVDTPPLPRDESLDAIPTARSVILPNGRRLPKRRRIFVDELVRALEAGAPFEAATIVAVVAAFPSRKKADARVRVAADVLAEPDVQYVLRVFRIITA